MKHKIKKIYENLPASEKKVAKYIIDHYHQSMLLSSQELAALAGVSDTAVIRFAKSLGFKGFLDYKKAIRQEHTASQKVYTSLKLMDNPGDGTFVSRYLAVGCASAYLFKK